MHRNPTPINTLDLTQLTFLIGRFQPSYMARKPIGAIATKWHKILGYAGLAAIEQLPKHINGVELTKLTTKRVPLKIKCETC